MSGKFALVIGNTEYADPGLAQLTAPGKDAEDFARVLKDRGVCSFDEVNVLLNQPESSVRGAIDEFFDQKKPDDLLVLYFSGHGVRDEIGALYLAVKNTIRSRLRSTAIKSDYIREVMDQSRSRRQVLVLDCCNSGAFQQGTKAATGMSVGTASAFEGGYGRIILTASDSTQFAWEGDKVIGETDNSLFTHYLVEGLEGEADLDGDGRITVDELYDYAYEKVKHATPKQTPSKFSSKQQGEIILRQNMPMEEIKSVPLPAPLLDSIDNPFSDIRLGAVTQLTKLLNGKNLGMARSAREALEKIAEEDDSRQVQRAAAQALGSVREEGRKAEVAEPDVRAKEAERIIQPRAEAAKRVVPQAIPSVEKSSAPTSNQQAILWMTSGWTIAGAIGGAVYWAAGDFAEPLGSIVGWGIGGMITAVILSSQKIISNEKNIYLVTLTWIIGGLISWAIGTGITEAYGAAIGETIGLVIALAGTLGIETLLSRRKDMLWLIFFWAISSAVGWSIGKSIQEAEGFLSSLYFGKTAGWSLGWAISGTIGGYVLGWQLLKTDSRPKMQTGKATKQIEAASQLDVGLKEILASRWKTLLWISPGWAICGAIGVIISNSVLFGHGMSGAIGGFITALALQTKNRDLNWKSIFLMTLAWAIGGAIGRATTVQLADNMGVSFGFGIGFGLGAMVGMGALLIGGLVPFDWKRITWIVLAWAISGQIGSSIFSELNYRYEVDYAASSMISVGIGWGIAGFVTSWLLSDYLNGSNP